MNKLLFIPVLLLCTFTLTGQEHRGYMNITSFGILKGTADVDNPAPISLLSEHHYRFNQSLSLGVITGIEQLNENTMPLAINLKGYLPLGACSLFFSGLGGYSISLEKPAYDGIQKATGGFLAGAETGLLIKINNGSAVMVALGYRYNVLHYRLNDWWRGNYTRDITYNRLAIRVGFAIF